MIRVVREIHRDLQVRPDCEIRRSEKSGNTYFLSRAWEPISEKVIVNRYIDVRSAYHRIGRRPRRSKPVLLKCWEFL
jgi:hypothetical protein